MTSMHVMGGAMTRFGKHPGVKAPELAQQAILAAVADAGVELKDIQAIYCANVLGGMILGQVILRDLGLAGIPVYNIENACASGATAVHLARHALLADQYDTVLVFGIEQLTQLGGGTIPMQRNDEKTDLFAQAGMVLPAIYAMRGTRFLHERDAQPADLAAIAVKNRYHGSLNEFAQQQTTVTLEEVLASRMIADPLTLLQCCPSQVDGAAALVLSKRAGPHAKDVRVLGSTVVSGLLEGARDDILDAEITARAARQAYEQAGIDPRDIGVVELHDAFTIAELIYYEALGLAAHGEAVSLLKSGATRIGGRVAVNPSGGLLAKGHPLGATGVAQMVELMWQLQGRAGKRQSNAPRIGVAQCTGGGIAGVDHAASSVHVLGCDMSAQRFQSGQVAAVTGAARGIGLRIAQRLAEAGVITYLLDRDELVLNEAVERLTADGLPVHGIALDLTEASAVDRAFAEIGEAYGALDFLVNNAGVVRDKRFLKMTEEDWDLVVNTNLRAQFLCCKAALPLMLERNFGRIVNLSSRAWLGGFGQANYSAAKGGVVSLTRSLAIEFAAKGITVNTIAPGIVDTPLFQSFEEAVQARLKDTVPVKRIGTPDDIANAVEFFLDPASSYVTGQTLYVCGGRSLSSASV